MLETIMNSFKKMVAMATVSVCAISANAEDLTIPNTFINGNVADANEINANFQAIVDEINALKAAIPVGTMVPYAGALTQTGDWLPCDGTEYSTALYPELFAVIGNTYGGGGGTFAVPDIEDRILGAAGVSNSAGIETGAETTTLSTSNIPSHEHFLVAAASATLTYSSVSAPYLATQANVGSGLLINENYEYQLRATNTSANSYKSSSVGSGTSFSIMQPTAFVGGYLIKAK